MGIVRWMCRFGKHLHTIKIRNDEFDSWIIKVRRDLNEDIICSICTYLYQYILTSGGKLYIMNMNPSIPTNLSEYNLLENLHDIIQIIRCNRLDVLVLSSRGEMYSREFYRNHKMILSSGIIKIAASDKFALALHEEGNVYIWVHIIRMVKPKITYQPVMLNTTHIIKSGNRVVKKYI